MCVCECECVCVCVCVSVCVWYVVWQYGSQVGSIAGRCKMVCCGDLLDREAQKRVQVQIVDCHCGYRVYVLSIFETV